MKKLTVGACISVQSQKFSAAETGVGKPQANFDFNMKMLNRIYYETTHVMSRLFSLSIYEVDICGNAKDKGIISFLRCKETDLTFHLTLQ